MSNLINIVLIYVVNLKNFEMSCPIIEVFCDKCGSKIKHMIILKSLKDILRSSKYKCSSCGQTLNPLDFSIELEKL